MHSTIRFTAFPRTAPPPQWTTSVVEVFVAKEAEIATVGRDKGLTSDEVMGRLRPNLMELGFDVEQGKRKGEKIERPVFFGENGAPSLRYEIDAYHPAWSCGLEVEAGRAWMGNAVYRDLVQALVMVQVEHLVLCVPNRYRYFTNGRSAESRDYDNTVGMADALYGHSRITMPYGLVVLGY